MNMAQEEKRGTIRANKTESKPTYDQVPETIQRTMSTIPDTLIPYQSCAAIIMIIFNRVSETSDQDCRGVSQRHSDSCFPPTQLGQ